MPADRFIHPRLGHSRKVSGLTDFQFRVWTQVMLSCDDFGVMRLSAVTLQSDNDALQERSARSLQKALGELATVGLIGTFDHQGRQHLYQPRWQDFQKVEYPRTTTRPLPTPDCLERCSEATRTLFGKYPGGQFKKNQKPFAESSESCSPIKDKDIPPTRAGALAERQTQTPAPQAHGLGQRPNPTNAELRRMPRLIDGPHVHHALCGTVCMHAGQFKSFVRKLGGDEAVAEKRVQAWFDDVNAAYAGKTIPVADEFKFWNMEYDRKFGTPVSKVDEKRSQIKNSDETERFLAEARAAQGGGVK